MGADRRIVIIAGPNGAGKSTFARELLRLECPDLPFLNADDIAASLDPRHPESQPWQAGRLMIAALDRHVEERSSFCLETTLAGVTYAKRIPTWRQRGYSVTLIFIALASAELAVARVAERVRHGGHSIPEATIRRRFELGRRNFERVYSRLVDQWILYDNSDTQMRVISWGVQA